MTAAATRIPPTRPEHTSRDPEALAATITEQEIAVRQYFTGHLEHKRWVVDGVEAKPVYGKPDIVGVLSPCCGKRRQQLRHGYAFSCPGCGWWWRYHCLGWTTRMVSIGKERPA